MLGFHHAERARPRRQDAKARPARGPYAGVQGSPGEDCQKTADRTQDSFPLVMLALTVFGVGQGLFISPNNSAIVAAAPARLTGEAGGLLNVTRSLGVSVGVGNGTGSRNRNRTRTSGVGSRQPDRVGDPAGPDTGAGGGRPAAIVLFPCVAQPRSNARNGRSRRRACAANLHLGRGDGSAAGAAFSRSLGKSFSFPGRRSRLTRTSCS